MAGLAVVVAVVVTAAHWPALSARALSFDDNQYLTENALVQHPSLESAGRFLSEVLTPSTVRGYYQPLAMISLMIDASMRDGPGDLRPFHRTSLALHVLNASLVVVLLYLLFGRPWVAAIVGLLYGVHPMTVEPIPWVGERKTLLTTFFCLWCLILYVRYARSAGAWRYGGCILMYVLALMSKPTSTPLPVVMLLLDYWPLRRLGKRVIIEKIPLLVIGGISAVITYISQARTAAVATSVKYSAAVVPLTLCHNVVFYLRKIVWPTDLSPHYPYPMPFGASQPAVLVGLIGTCLLVAALLISWRWTRAAIVGWLVFFVAIFPTMGVVGFTHSIASDKYTYLPAIGLLLIAAWGLGFAWDAVSRRPSQRVGHALIVVAAVILAGFEITATRRQLAHWQDTEGHFRYMLTLAPNARVLHFGLGDALRQKAQAERSSKLFDEAAREYELATRPGADSPFGRNDLLTCAAHNNLANILALHGQIDQAVKHWRRVLEMNPEDYKAHNNLAIALSMQGKTEEAIAHYTEALRLRPNLADAHNALGALLAKRGDLGPAIPHFTEALRLQPNSPAALRNLEATLTRQGRSPDEIQSYLRSLGIIRPSAPARRTR